jgi:threonine dehydratase
MNRDLLPAHAVLAANRIAAYIRETPLDYSPFFSELSGANVYLKLENLQYTGSFKLRGAFNKLLSLSEEEREVGGVAASSGNHGAAIAYAMNKLDIKGTIFVPEQTSATKVDAIKRFGGDVRFFGTDGLDTETHARAYAKEHGMVYLAGNLRRRNSKSVTGCRCDIYCGRRWRAYQWRRSIPEVGESLNRRRRLSAGRVSGHDGIH